MTDGPRLGPSVTANGFRTTVAGEAGPELLCSGPYSGLCWLTGPVLAFSGLTEGFTMLAGLNRRKFCALSALSVLFKMDRTEPGAERPD